ncbi:DUF5777 family beta-barrel protein [Flavobacterium sp. NG2]|uniref:DUF5777 family beta-barrel protein n=1 Tax=Flavobacterium sp. NG2 TaxID=3097547 RepID=UPI002A8362B1|nr:DUF5777 family beta-barrel protein [Flavobacterium sp. NG2]WPR71045.1 DUF5777 family beta-barrel protein [Flavobacterium sp. NG2]
MKYLLITLLVPFYMLSQNDLLSEIDTKKVDTKSTSAFKSLKIVNFESTKLVGKGDLFFVVAHRFDYVKNGFEDFFGIDDAVTQIKFAYGLTEGVTLHISRTGFQKTYDAGIKYLLVSQKSDGFPLTIVGFNSVAINSEMKKQFFPLLEFKHRLTYVSQLLVSRKVSDKLSLELAPTFFHENVVRDILDSNNNVITPNPQENSQLAIGIGGRYKLAKRWSLNMDYGAHLNRASQSIYKNPISIGVDLETGGHVFQMHFTNSRAMHESGFLGQTTGEWTKGEISFGFNLVRVF